jgi:hypothetical protein
MKLLPEPEYIHRRPQTITIPLLKWVESSEGRTDKRLLTENAGTVIRECPRKKDQ